MLKLVMTKIKTNLERGRQMFGWLNENSKDWVEQSTTVQTKEMGKHEMSRANIFL
jgi:hypothetical protein